MIPSSGLGETFWLLFVVFISGLTFVVLFPLLLWPDSGAEWGVSSASQDQLLGGCNSFQAEFELVIANNDDMGVTVSLIQMTFSLLPGPPGVFNRWFLIRQDVQNTPSSPIWYTLIPRQLGTDSFSLLLQVSHNVSTMLCWCGVTYGGSLPISDHGGLLTPISLRNPWRGLTRRPPGASLRYIVE